VSFAQPQFLLFFAAVFAAYWAMPHRRAQNALLVAASAVFYGWIHPWFVAILFSSAVVDFAVGRAMGQHPQHRRKLLGLSLVANLGALGFFKYADFFLTNVAAALTSLGLGADVHTLGILLPVGISFYTFQTMSYTLDIYRGTLQPRDSFLDYLAFVSFFPQLVAGPIERAARLLPQLERPRVWDGARVQSGLWLALFGLFKKLVVADTLGIYVDRVFTLAEPGGPMIWAGAAVFGLQLYADFSAYTDLARGTARMMGFDLVRNFDAPFLAKNTPDFWRRWHMSLSFWIRDYLLVPLLGRKQPIGAARLAMAVTISFLLIGFWHGAGWNFLLFGAWHALWVLATLAVLPRLPSALTSLPGASAAAVLLHTVAVQLPGALIFREPRIAQIPQHFAHPPWSGETTQFQLAIFLLALGATLSLPLLLEVAWRRSLRPSFARAGMAAWAPAVENAARAAMVVGVVVFTRRVSTDFIYFQF
jgi:alginate O-acetyltransferase complex protein AlgI